VLYLVPCKVAFSKEKATYHRAFGVQQLENS